MAMTFDEFCSRLAHLRLDRSGGLVKPYKPILVAAVVILGQQGEAAQPKRAPRRWPASRWPKKAKPEYPFRHLENDGIWNLIPIEGVEPAARRWWVFELKRGRSADRVVGQVSRHLGWIGEERRGNRESAVGAIIVQKADPKLRYAAKSNEQLSLWEYDDELAIRQIA
jgi:hypothetical protein